MNKRFLIALPAVIVVAGLAYTGSAWHLGKSIEAQHEKAVQDLNKILVGQKIKLTNYTYDRGLFGATETATFELALPDSNQRAAAEAQTTVRFTAQSQITHGPFPHFSGIAAGTAESTLVFEDDLKKALQSLFGEKSPLSMHTQYGFDSSAEITVSSPEASSSPQGNNASWNWGGLTAKINLTKDKNATWQLDMPKIAFSEKLENSGATVHMQIFGTKGEGNSSAPLFADLPLSALGAAKLSVDTVSLEGAGNMPYTELKGLTYEVSVPGNTEFIDLIGKISAASLTVGKANGMRYGPFHYDASLKHLHARSFSELYTAWATFSNAGDISSEALEGFLASQKKHIETLAINNPAFSIDRLSATTPQGEAKLVGTAKLQGANAESLTQAELLIPVLDISLEASVAETLAAQLMPGDALANLTNIPYIKRENGQLTSRLSFVKGVLTINGETVDTAAALRQITGAPSSEDGEEGEEEDDSDS